MDNTDIHLAAIFAGVFIVAAMIGQLQQHPIDVGAIKQGLSTFWQWWLSTDYMNSIAAIMALMMLLLVNWGGY